MSLAFYRELFIELMTNHIFPTTTMKAQGKKKTGSQQNKYLS
jgi:hypothetical protein